MFYQLCKLGLDPELNNNYVVGEKKQEQIKLKLSNETEITNNYFTDNFQ